MTAATMERPGITTATEQPIRLSVPYGDLAAALDLMGAVCSSRPPVPVLGGALITVGHAGDAFIETFDYETHVRVLLDGGIRPGRILLNRQQLAFCLRTVLAGATRAKQARLPVEITTVGSNADFLVDGYRFSLPLMPVEDYPATPAYPDERVLTVSRDALLTEVNRLSVCAGKDQTLPQLTGINFVTVPGGLELAATDRFRLGIGYVPTVESGVEVNRLVPAKPLPAILKQPARRPRHRRLLRHRRRRARAGPGSRPGRCRCPCAGSSSSSSSTAPCCPRSTRWTWWWTGSRWRWPPCGSPRSPTAATTCRPPSPTAPSPCPPGARTTAR